MRILKTKTAGLDRLMKTGSLVGVLGVLVALPLLGDEIRLEGGAKIAGEVLKRTDDRIVIDLGFTVLEIPADRVVSIDESSPGESETGSAELATDRKAERRDSIFFGANLEPGSIKDKADIVSEGVVKVVCPGKSGSGFIINDEEGYVLTNFHVIEGDRDIKVVIYERTDGELRRLTLSRIRIIAFNPYFDIALLKIEDRIPDGSEDPESAVTLKKVYLGDFSRVAPGDHVFAVGNPLGLERTVSEGIVSNHHRAIGGLLYIQTTAPINPGNSGGPLFNDRGEVIGITSLKVPLFEGLGFAIPINVVKDFVRSREAFAFDKDNANSGIRYFAPPRKSDSTNGSK